MTSGLSIILAIGTVLMIAVMFVCRRWRSFLVWKLPCIAVLLTTAGVVGVKLMYFIESGDWGGMSFFGAVLFVPMMFVLVKFLLRVPFGEVMDLCAPAECVMLALMKLNCYFEGCCGGRVVGIDAGGQEIQFPSQIVELIFALFIMVALMLFMKKGNEEKVYPMYMVLYGVSRFILNLLRETVPFIWILPAGNFWSLVSIVIGILWFVILKQTHGRKHELSIR